MIDPRCYTSHELREFALGMLPDDFSEQVFAHLAQCPACEDTVAELDQADDTLVRSLRDPQRPRNRSESACQNAVDRVRATPLMPEPMPLNHSAALPVQVGEYRLVSKLGSGGMGAVYRAVHTRLDRPVAIKLLPSRRLRVDGAVARFQREMKAVGQLDHPAIVQATDAGESDGMHFLVMELVDGYDLSRIVHLSGAIAVADACEVARQVALGLQHAHAKEIIHRDVKPSNVMLTRSGKVKILDLGLALLSGVHGPGDELTTVGQLMGTLDYMSPEQCDDSHQVDARTDVYGLAATLYKLLTGAAPYFDERWQSPLQKLKALATAEAPVPLVDRRSDLPHGLTVLIDRGLSRDAGARFETVEHFASALEPWSQGHDLEALVATVDDHEEPELPVGTPPSSRSFSRVGGAKRGRDEKGVRGRPGMRAVVFLLLAPLLVLAGFAIYLKTDTGHLVVECADADVAIKILESGTTYKEMQLERGQSSIRVRAGQYEIVMDGESDGLVVTDGQFTIRRGDVWVARIARRSGPLPPSDSDRDGSLSPIKKALTRLEQGIAELVARRAQTDPTGFDQGSPRKTTEGQLAVELFRLKTELAERRRFLGPSHPEVTRLEKKIEAARQTVERLTTGRARLEDLPGPRYAGRTLDEWEQVLQTDRSFELIVEAVRAIAGLAKGARHEIVEKAARVLVRSARTLDLQQTGFTDGATQTTEMVLQHELSQLMVTHGEVIDRVLLEELREGNEGSRRMVTSVTRSVEALIEASRDDGPAVRGLAYQRLFVLPLETRKLPRVLARLREIAASDELGHAARAAAALADIDTSSTDLMSRLIELLQQGSASVQADAAWTIRRLGGGAREAVPALMEVVRNGSEKGIFTPVELMRISSSGHQQLSAKDAAIVALGDIGPPAKEALPLLVEESMRQNGDKRDLPQAFTVDAAIDKIDRWDSGTGLHNYTLGPGDVLGVFIEGVIGGDAAGQPQLISSPRSFGFSPASGFPVLVQSDGTINLPFVGSIPVSGLTLTQVTNVIRRSYTVDNKVLRVGKEKILLSLVERRTAKRSWLMKKYLIESGDVLAVYVAGVLGNPDDMGPVHFPDDARLPATFGHPVVVAEGSISLPHVPPLAITGLTIRQATDVVRRAYVDDAVILKKSAFISIGVLMRRVE